MYPSQVDVTSVTGRRGEGHPKVPGARWSLFTKPVRCDPKCANITPMRTKAKVFAWLLASLCTLSNALDAAPYRVTVNLGWLELTRIDGGWEVGRVRELGDWNLPLREGDLLTQVETHRTADLGPLSIAAFMQDAVVHPVHVVVRRKEASLTLEVFAVSEEERAGSSRVEEEYGIGLMLVPVDGGSGVIVLRSIPGSPAEKAGLRPGDKVSAVGGKDVSTLTVSDVSKLLRSDRPSPVPVRVLRDNNQIDFTVDRVSTRQLFGTSEGSSKTIPIDKTADLAPDFDLLSARGRHIMVRSFRGKWVLLNFWGVWCAPCHYEIPWLESWNKRFSGQLVILGLDVSDKPDSLQRFLVRHPLPYEVLAGGQLGGALTTAYGVRAVPLNVVIDPDGLVRYVQAGFEPASPTEPPRLEWYLNRAMRP